MIALGILLLIVGFVAKVAILWTIGLVLLVVGLVLVVLGSMGRSVGDDAITTDRAGIRGPAALSVSMTKCRGPAVRCPRCGLIIAPRMPTLSPRHCPRCLGRHRVVVELEMLPSQSSGDDSPQAR